MGEVPGRRRGACRAGLALPLVWGLCGAVGTGGCAPGYGDVRYQSREAVSPPSVPESEVIVVATGDAAFEPIGELELTGGSTSAAQRGCLREAAARGGDGVSTPSPRRDGALPGDASAARTFVCVVYRRRRGPVPAPSSTAPAPTPRRLSATIPEGKGWFCADVLGKFSSCERAIDRCKEARAAGVRELEKLGRRDRLQDCRMTSAAHCFTFVDLSRRKGGWQCASGEQLCSTVQSAYARSSEYEDVTTCRRVP